eukprot:156346-Chlamydomonas_euryale.AAC.10
MYGPCGASQDLKGVSPTTPIPNASCNYGLQGAMAFLHPHPATGVWAAIAWRRGSLSASPSPMHGAAAQPHGSSSPFLRH